MVTIMLYAIYQYFLVDPVAYLSTAYLSAFYAAFAISGVLVFMRTAHIIASVFTSASLVVAINQPSISIFAAHLATASYLFIFSIFVYVFFLKITGKETPKVLHPDWY